MVHFPSCRLLFLIIMYFVTFVIVCYFSFNLRHLRRWGIKVNWIYFYTMWSCLFRGHKFRVVQFQYALIDV